MPKLLLEGQPNNMGGEAANPFGVHDFEKRPPGTGALTVQPGHDLRLRYRVLLHGAGWDAARLDASYRAWIDD